ncbi:MAG: amidohydrolase [Candidatus Latescibacteria bacterium]|nr:amidohydrolase [Candidatus Latescibacterota bacterium]
MDIEAGLRRPKIDVHAHVSGTEISCDALMASGDPVGVREFWCSRPITGGRIAPHEEVRRQNDDILRAMVLRPDRIQGMCFVIPGHYREALAEVERCLDAGMVGVKLYNQYKISDPAVGPVLALAAERRVPLLEHAGYLTGPEHLSQQPLISHGADFAEASERHPETMLIHAHISGGGDWEWTVRAMRNASPNVFIDVSGSNLDDGQVEFAVAELGASRVLFGSDGTMAGSVGKVLDAALTDEEKEMIFWGNAERILAAQGRKPLHPRSPTERAIS